MMKFHYILFDYDGTLLCSNVEKEIALDIISAITQDFEIIRCPLHKNKCRMTFDDLSFGRFFFCSLDVRKSSRIFSDRRDSLIEALTEIQNRLDEVERKLLKDFDRFSHDLLTYNAETLHSFYKLIPPEDLGSGTVQQLDAIRLSIQSDPEKAARVLLSMVKAQLLLKAEFTAFEQLKGNVKSDYYSVEIHKVFYSVFNLFADDFLQKGSSFKLGECSALVSADYESLMAALIKVIENIVKYCANDSAVNVFFVEKQHHIVVSIDMTSLCVKEHEKTKIFEEGYSGECALRSKLAGKGLGMYLAKRLLEKNHAGIVFIPRIEILQQKIRQGNEHYEKNRMEISFKKAL